MTHEGSSMSEQEKRLVEIALTGCLNADRREEGQRAFRALLESHRQEVERLEAEVDEESSARETYLRKLEQAERERDEARADNAALLEASVVAERSILAGEVQEGLGHLSHVSLRNHPGAAVLRELEVRRAFEARLRNEAEGWDHGEDCPAIEDEETSPPCECCRGDVLKMLDEAVKARGGQ